MTKKVLNLYKICIEKIAQLLKRGYWVADCFTDNPFNLLPSSIIDELIVCVAHLSVCQPLKKSDICQLIATGRIRSFILEDINVSHDDFISILLSLSLSCQNLILIKLKHVFFLNGAVAFSTCRIITTAEALECLISGSPRLESVESCIEFNLKALRISKQLKQLTLNFTPQCYFYLYDFLEESDGQFCSNNSSIFKLLEDDRDRSLYLCIPDILKFCTELREINCDISKSLEHLHAEELRDGTLCTKYKLEKCWIGDTYVDDGKAVVSKDGIYIASLTCPNLKEIAVLVSDYSTIKALCNFSNLTSLLLVWDGMHSRNFRLGVKILLEKVGKKLKTLHIVHFSNVDFSVIGINCPNLEELKVQFVSERNLQQFPSTAFQKLCRLYIDNRNCLSSSLIGLLSNCINLKLLTLQSAEALTDSVLSDILKKNSLSKVRNAQINNCALSAVGLKNLASNLRSLEYLKITSSLVVFDLAAHILHRINREIIVSEVMGN